MTSFTINWHLVGFVVLLIAVLLTALLAFAALSLSVLRLFTRASAAGNGSSKVSSSQPVASNGQPSANADMEKLVDALAIRIRATPSISFPNHPAMAAVADVIQKSARTEAALSKVVQAVAEANETAAGTKATA